MTFAKRLAVIVADEALEAAEEFERGLLSAFDHAPDDFTAEEHAALGLLMANAAGRVKMRKAEVF